MNIPPLRTADLRPLLARADADHDELLGALADVANSLAESLDVVDALVASDAPMPPRRDPGRPPSAGENQWNGWRWRGELGGENSGPLAGRKLAIKDSIAVAGWPMALGTEVLGGYVPHADATVVSRALDAGATIVGKAECEYLCASGGSHTASTGPVVNPLDRSRMAGGSSSGCAALVAAGDVDLAIGGDQGGSVRVPASYTGTVGMKPTFGLVPCTGALSLETSIDHIGPITRTVRDNATLLGVLAGDDGRDTRSRGLRSVDFAASLDQGVPGLRIALVDEGFHQPDADPDVNADVEQAAAMLETHGARVGRVSVPRHASSPSVFLPVVLAGFAHDLLGAPGASTGRIVDQALDFADALAAARRRSRRQPSNITALVALAAHVAAHTGFHHYVAAQQLARQLSQAYDSLWARYDAILMPTTPTRAPPFPDPGDPAAVTVASMTPLANSCAFNLTGHPALSVPWWNATKLPTGVMIVGPRHSEPTLYRIGHAIESGQPARGTASLANRAR